MSKLRIFLGALALSALMAVVISLSGCAPEQEAALIQVGTNSAVSFGLMAIQSDQVVPNAQLALDTIDNDILPILNGDQAGLENGLADILALKAFDSNPTLAKVKTLLEAALLAGLPPDLLNNAIDQATGKLTPTALQNIQRIRADLLAGFTGAKQGLEAYLASGSKDFSRGVNFQALRNKLAAK